MLIYKDNLINNKIVLGSIEEEYKLDQLFNWRCIMNYKDKTIYKNSEDDLAIINLEQQLSFTALQIEARF